MNVARPVAGALRVGSLSSFSETDSTPSRSVINSTIASQASSLWGKCCLQYVVAQCCDRTVMMSIDAVDRGEHDTPNAFTTVLAQGQSTIVAGVQHVPVNVGAR